MGQLHVRDKALLLKIAARIKKLRKQKSLSQEEAYNDTNVHVARIESVQTNPTISSLNALCKYFGITLQEFFKGI